MSTALASSHNEKTPPSSSHNSDERLSLLSPKALSACSDKELHDYIHACAEQFLVAQRRWEATGCFSAVGERDSWWHAESDALVERGNRPLA